MRLRALALSVMREMMNSLSIHAAEAQEKAAPLSFLEEQRQKYMNKKKNYASREKWTLEKLAQFKSKLREVEVTSTTQEEQEENGSSKMQLDGAENGGEKRKKKIQQAEVEDDDDDEEEENDDSDAEAPPAKPKRSGAAAADKSWLGHQLKFEPASVASVGTAACLHAHAVAHC